MFAGGGKKIFGDFHRKLPSFCGGIHVNFTIFAGGGMYCEVGHPTDGSALCRACWSQEQAQRNARLVVMHHLAPASMGSSAPSFVSNDSPPVTSFGIEDKRDRTLCDAIRERWRTLACVAFSSVTLIILLAVLLSVHKSVFFPPRDDQDLTLNCQQGNQESFYVHCRELPICGACLADPTTEDCARDVPGGKVVRNLHYVNCKGLTNISLTNVVGVCGDFLVVGNQALVNISISNIYCGVAGWTRLERNPSAEFLDLTWIKDLSALSIQDNTLLSIIDLSRAILQRTGGYLTIARNPSLKSITFSDFLESYGLIDISSNAALLKIMAAISVLPGTLRIWDNRLLNEVEIVRLSTITGTLRIWDNGAANNPPYVIPNCHIAPIFKPTGTIQVQANCPQDL
eukprot:g63378.t1